MEQLPDKVFIVFLDLGLLRLQKSLDHSEVPFGIHVIRILQYQLLLGVPEGLELLKDVRCRTIDEVRRAVGKAIEFYNNERPHMSLNNLTPRRAAACTGRLQKRWTSYREKHLESLEIKEGACTFAPQTLKTIERRSAVPIQ